MKIPILKLWPSNAFLYQIFQPCIRLSEPLRESSNDTLDFRFLLYGQAAALNRGNASSQACAKASGKKHRT